MDGQLHLPHSDEGMVVLLKRQLSNYTWACFRLNALKVGAAYESTKLDTNNNEAFTGVALMENGLEVLLPNKLATSLVTYRRLS